MPAIGEKAPPFSLPDQNGKTVQLSDFLGAPVVLFFYPKSFTPGCTQEVCSFRDQFAVFQDAGAVVLGISDDSIDTQAAFAAQHQLPFLVLSDRKGLVRQQYRVPKTLGILPGRVTYVIDAKGVVQHVFSSQLNVEKHIQEAIQVITKGQND
ncbi:MAG: peroxiredoxin [Cyanobacteria bacterium]|nr:peroxiredoxin [Cyanobacteriota bacterium]